MWTAEDVRNDRHCPPDATPEQLERWAKLMNDMEPKYQTLAERAAEFRNQEIKTIGIADPLLQLEAYFSEPREQDVTARAALSMLREEIEAAASDIYNDGDLVEAYVRLERLIDK